MSKLIEIQEKLQNTSAAIASVERAIASDPKSFALQVTAHSLLVKQAELEALFYELADQVGVDVCKYRLFKDNELPNIYSISKALGDFQRLFSIVYDALKNGPKKKAKMGSELIEETSLGFGYAFSGSLGIVLTISNERLLLGKTIIDEAVDTVFKIANSQEPEAIREYVRPLGPPTIKAMYDWANDHVYSGFGADIEWRKGPDIKVDFIKELGHFEKLREALIETGDEEVQEFSIAGELVGADVSRRTFHLRNDRGEDIRGNFIDAINSEHTVELPKRYQFTLRKSTKKIYATDVEKINYTLTRLRRIASR